MTYLLVEELARFLLDGIDELYLSCREAHQQGHALCGGREVVKVVAGRLRSLVDALVDGLAQVGGLERKIQSQRQCSSTCTFKN